MGHHRFGGTESIGNGAKPSGDLESIRGGLRVAAVPGGVDGDGKETGAGHGGGEVGHLGSPTTPAVGQDHRRTGTDRVAGSGPAVDYHLDRLGTGEPGTVPVDCFRGWGEVG